MRVCAICGKSVYPTYDDDTLSGWKHRVFDGSHEVKIKE